MGKAHDELLKVDLPVPVVIKYINHSPANASVLQDESNVEDGKIPDEGILLQLG